MSSGTTYKYLADLLDQVAVEVREIEALGRKALYGDNDDDVYRELMRRKAMKLSGLAKEAESLTKSVKAEVAERIERFSLSASQSLEIGSVFFMSALLYPDDYKEGEPNDLEIFAAEVRVMKD
ncbi:MAG TPA: hypothetical protein DCS48_15460 [Desulfovibrio sp.]|nr:hypothetical protein [Desulfovibrio sp.]